MNKNPIAKNPTTPRGFTLVELLVVIVIIAVFAAIGFPIANKVKQSADKTQCMSKLHAWGIVIGAYAAEHDGKVNFEHWPSINNDPLIASPYVPYWTGDASNASTGFANQTAQRYCPAVKWNKVGNQPVCYAMIQPVGIAKVGIQGRVDGKSSDYPLAKITATNRFMLMIDATAAGYTIQTEGDFNTKVKPLTVAGVNLRHNHGVNALFADYSVRVMTWPEIQKGLGWWTTF